MAAAVLCAAATTATATFPSIEGRVIDIGGRPLAEATVEAPELGLRTRTDCDGSFDFPTLLLGTWTIVAKMPDGREGSAAIHVRDSDARERVEIAVRHPRARELACICPTTCVVMRPRTSEEGQRKALSSLPADLRVALTNVYDNEEHERSVAEVASDQRLPATLRGLVPLLDDADEGVVWRVRSVLQTILDAATGDHDEVLGPFVGVLEHGGPVARALVVELMSGLDTDAAQGVIVAALDDPSPWIRSMAVHVLEDWRDDLLPETLSGLLSVGQRLQRDAEEALADPEPRCEAATVDACRRETLARDTAAAFAALELLMQDECEWRQLAVDVLADAVENGDPRLAPLAAEGLANDGDDCTRAAQLEALLAASASDDSAVRQAVAAAFALLMRTGTGAAAEP